MWKDSNRNIVVIFQPNILRIVGFYVRHSANVHSYALVIMHVIILNFQLGSYHTARSDTFLLHSV